MGPEHKASEITHSLKECLQKLYCTIYPSLAITEDEICPNAFILQTAGRAGNETTGF